jgi:hypothetical protein
LQVLAEARNACKGAQTNEPITESFVRDCLPGERYAPIHEHQRPTRCKLEASIGLKKRPRPQSHPYNRYTSYAPDFLSLAERHESLRPFVRIVHGKGKLDFKDWHAVHALTQALLAEDFGISGWSIPLGRLVPAVPNRLNYVLWIRDLLDLSSTGLLPLTLFFRNKYCYYCKLVVDALN